MCCSLSSLRCSRTRELEVTGNPRCQVPVLPALTLAPLRCTDAGWHAGQSPTERWPPAPELGWIKSHTLLTERRGDRFLYHYSRPSILQGAEHTLSRLVTPRHPRPHPEPTRWMRSPGRFLPHHTDALRDNDAGSYSEILHETPFPWASTLPWQQSLSMVSDKEGSART